MLRSSVIPLPPRLITLAILAAFGASIVYHQRSASTASADAQTPKQQKRINPKRERDIRSRTKTSVGPVWFKHKDHQLPEAAPDCRSCHPILATRDLGAAVPKASIKHYPYPYHDKCLDCHRFKTPQFFRGTTPAICAICHTGSSPQLTKKDMNPLPKQSEQMVLSDLSRKFDHESTSHVRECMTCHNIAQLDFGKADVPVDTCASANCHLRKTFQDGKEIPGFDFEMGELTDADFVGRRDQHTCLSCHSFVIGGTPPPCTHFNLFDTDGSYFNSKDFPKAAELISELRCR